MHARRERRYYLGNAKSRINHASIHECPGCSSSCRRTAHRSDCENMAWGLPMAEHIPLVRVHIARWGTADKGCWLSATFTSKFTSIFIASTTIPARRLLTIGGCGSLPPRKCRADDASNSNKNSCESRGPPLFSDWGWRLVWGDESRLRAVLGTAPSEVRNYRYLR